MIKMFVLFALEPRFFHKSIDKRIPYFFFSNRLAHEPVEIQNLDPRTAERIRKRVMLFSRAFEIRNIVE